MTILYVSFPDDFEQRYNKYRARILSSQKLSDTEVKDISKTAQQDSRPYCIVDGKWGFLKFSKQSKKIKIGGKDAQPFKLLQCLTEPFGTAKMIETVFEAIRENLKYKSKKGIYTNGIDKTQKIKLIKNVIKELQKGNKLQGKIIFKRDELNIKVWLEYLG